MENSDVKNGKPEAKSKLKCVLLAFCGVFIGAANGFFGGGGGMLLVPALAYLGKLEEKKAHATALAVMLPLSVISAVVYTVRGVSDVNLAVTCGGGVLLGGLFGAFALAKVPKNLLTVIFYGIMIAAGVKMII